MTSTDSTVTPTVAAALAQRPLGGPGTGDHRGGRRDQHISDGTPARRPNGPCRNVFRGCARAGRLTARPWRRGGRRRRHRCGRTRGPPGHTGADGADVPPRRRGSVAAAGGGSRRQARRRADFPDQGDTRARDSSRCGGQRRRPAGLRSSGGHPRRGCATRCERHLRGVRRRARDAVLRGRGGPLHRCGPHRDGRRHRGLHDQLRPVEAGQRRAGDEPRRSPTTGHLVRTATHRG